MKKNNSGKNFNINNNKEISLNLWDLNQKNYVNNNNKKYFPFESEQNKNKKIKFKNQIL